VKLNPGTKLLLIVLFLAIPALAGWGMSKATSRTQALPPPPQVEQPVSTMPVEIIEKGHPTLKIQVPIEHQSIPEVSVLLLAPIGWLLLLRRQK